MSRKERGYLRLLSRTFGKGCLPSGERDGTGATLAHVLKDVLRNLPKRPSQKGG